MDADLAFWSLPAARFGVDAAAYYSFVTHGAYSADDVRGRAGLA